MQRLNNNVKYEELNANGPRGVRFPYSIFFYLNNNTCYATHNMLRKTVKEVTHMERIVPKPVMESKFREQIDNMLENGNTYTQISNWLSNNGETISRQIISRYHKFGYNINVKAAAKYAESQDASDKRLEVAAMKQSDTLRLYDKIIAAAIDVNPDLLDDRSKMDMAIKAAKQREDFMREHGDSALEEMAATIEELRAEIRDMNLLDLVRGISDDRVKKRIKEEDST